MPIKDRTLLGSSGYVAQWGKITGSADESKQTRSFPLSITTLYSLHIQAHRTEGSDHGYLEFMNGHGYYSNTKSQFSFYDADYGFNKWYFMVGKV